MTTTLTTTTNEETKKRNEKKKKTENLKACAEARDTYIIGYIVDTRQAADIKPKRGGDY